MQIGMFDDSFDDFRSLKAFARYEERDDGT